MLTFRLKARDDRKQVEVKQEKEKTIKCPVYYDGESLVGQVSGSVLLQWWHSCRDVRHTGNCAGTGWKETRA